MPAPADLEPPKGLGLGLGLGFRLWSGWSGPKCKVEIDHTPSAQSFLQDAPAQRGSTTVAHVGQITYITIYVI